MNTEYNINITAAENGYILNKSTATEGEKDGAFYSDYKSETFVFTDWDEAIDWLKTNGK